MVVLSSVREYQSIPLRRAMEHHGVRPVVAAERMGVPLSHFCDVLTARQTVTAWFASRMETALRLRPSEVVDIVNGSALYEWYRNPRGRTHPFEVP